MAMQHDPAVLPGTGEALVEPAAGSIAAAIVRFNAEWVQHQPVTVRRTYERSLALLVRDLDGDPGCAAPLAALTPERLERHLQWRVEQRLNFRAELLRAGVQLARFAAWCGQEAGVVIDASRDRMREAAERVAAEHGLSFGVEPDDPSPR